MQQIPAAGLCRDCGEETRLEGFPLQCQACGGFDLEILQGEELFVESLEMEEASVSQRTDGPGERETP